jgi:hypothetical protein
MAMLPLSLIIPILNIEFIPNIPVASTEFPLVFNDFGNVGKDVAQTDVGNSFEWDIVSLFFLLYGSVVLFCLIKLVLNGIKLIKIKRGSTTHIDGRFSIINANVSSIFSCFKWIFIPLNNNSGISNSIIEHEKLHGRAYHTLDLIATELFVAFLWFNPFVYFFRRDLKSVHEFQIDNSLLKGDVKKSNYLKQMLNNLECSNKAVGFCNNFNGSTIKKRIEMIMKDKSSKWKLGRYLFLLPLISLMTMSFSGKANNEGSIPSVSPIKVGEYDKISSEYGMRIHPITREKKFHYGVDFAAKTGTPVIATANGIVTKVIFLENSYGKLVEIDHGNGFLTRYAQMSEYAVKEGDKVKKGDVVGSVGESGRSTGPHLHYEVLNDGENVNPQDYIND